MKIVQPPGWPRPSGYANGVIATGRVVAVSGQIGWNPTTETFETDEMAAQARQALDNLVVVLRTAGAEPRDVVRLTWYVTDRADYLAARREIGEAYRALFGDHYPAMSVVVVAAGAEIMRVCADVGGSISGEHGIGLEKADFMPFIFSPADLDLAKTAGEMLVFSAADFEDFLEPRPDLPKALETELTEVVTILAKNRWPFRLHATYDETTLAQELCAKGTRFVEASAGQIAELRAAFQPVIDGLAADPADAQLLQAIQEIAAEHPATEQPDVPASCAQFAATKGEEAAPAPSGKSAIPEGIYRVELTADEVEAAVGFNEGGWSGTWTLSIEGGEWQLSCKVLDPDSDCGGAVGVDGPLEAGEVRGTGDLVHLVGSEELYSSLTGCELPATGVEGHCNPALSYEFTWEADGDTLKFTDAPGGLDDAYTFVIEPWTRID